MTVGGGSSPPEGADDAVDADHPAGVGEQQGQERPGLRAADVEECAVGTGDLERSEDAVAHERGSSQAEGPCGTPFRAQARLQVGCKYPPSRPRDSSSRPVQTRGAAAAPPEETP